MSGPTEENGGKSSKNPTLTTPALVILARASARAGAPKAKATNNDNPANPVTFLETNVMDSGPRVGRIRGKTRQADAGKATHPLCGCRRHFDRDCAPGRG